MLALVLVVVNIAFVVLILFLVPDVNNADHNVRSVISEALVRQDGKLAVRDTEDLKELVTSSPSFWFVAVDKQGQRAQHGEIPAIYQPLIPNLDSIRFVDVRGEEGSPLTAADVNDLETEAGSVHVLYGGRGLPGSYLVNVIVGLGVIYVPFTIVPLLVVFVAIPWIVGRAFAGMRKTTSRAASIGENSLGVRLPTDDVVEELDPLVNAVNLALARIDEHIRSRQRFLADAAHELRTPIAILCTRLEALGDSEEKSRLLQDARRLATVADQLLDAERFAAVLTWQDVDIVDLCETVVADLAPMAIGAGYEVEFKTENPSFILSGDRIAMERAITNLIKNAIQHGGGKGCITIQVAADGTVDVSDEGPGVAPDEREKIFEPFYRTQPRPSGAGLGLTLVRQIANLHQGGITVLEQSRGIRFRLRFQRAVTEAA